MIYLTIKNNSGGYHGHQLKDMFGGITIAKMFGFTYAHNGNPYLEFFGLGKNELAVADLPQNLEIVSVNDPVWVWGGFGYEKAVKIFTRIKNKHKERDCLIVLEKAQRIHPFQTIKWRKKGLIKKNIFKEIVEETNSKFIAKHQERKHQFDKVGTVYIAMHISRGMDYDSKRFPKHFSTSEYPRFMFTVNYYRRIIELLQSALRGKKHEIHIYTEKLNSEEIVVELKNKNNIYFHLGDNRDQGNHEQICDIFYHFIMSDILVACNSSFSVVASYFRNKGNTIYHPHLHLKDLPVNTYITTDIHGNFNINHLRL